MKRTIITLLALLSLSVMVPAAYAQEYIPEVSTLSELQQAIAEAEPEPTPAPSPEPSKPSSGGHSHFPHTPKPEVKPEPATEPSTPLLKCDRAVIDKANVVDMISYVKRFVPAQERLTRGKFAALLYGLLSSESKVDCDKIAENCFDDLYGSPYESAVSALTGAGAFCGGCGGTFLPMDNF